MSDHKISIELTVTTETVADGIFELVADILNNPIFDTHFDVAVSMEPFETSVEPDCS